MPLRLPTVSNLPRATACSLSVVGEQMPDSEPGAAAKRGSLIHALIAADLRGWEKPDAGRYRIKYDLEKLRAFLGEGDLKCELAMAWSNEDWTTRILGENIGREYGTSYEICGAADIVMLRPRSALVVDVKTGTYPVASPADNWQLAALATMVYGLDDMDEATGALAFLGRDGDWRFESHTWNAVELDAIAARLERYHAMWSESAAQAEAGWLPPPAVGTHCRWCPTVCSHNERKQ